MKVLIIFSALLAISSVASAEKVDLPKEIAAAGNNLIVLDFYATWCSSCRTIAPKVDEFAALYKDVTFIKIDSNDNEDIADQFKLTSLPTFVFIKNGRTVDKFSGTKFEQLRRIILRHK